MPRDALGAHHRHVKGHAMIDSAAPKGEPPLSYGGYLDLERLLSAQRPLSGQHDEMLFIIIHQVSELWLKLCLHELTAAKACIDADHLGPAFKMIARAARIQALLIQGWDVLATMTPSDYARIRPHLGGSSGFQSWQYRLLEFLLGDKNAAMLAPHQDHPERLALMGCALATPSLYDRCLALLDRRGFALPRTVLDRDWRTPYQPCASVEAAWLRVYQAPERHWDLYELAEKLVDLDYRFQQWRFSHMKTVERIIGDGPGTGGTSGVAYLAQALGRRFFPELLSLRGKLDLPDSDLLNP
jgi:tryptophan 2,3-dioxygenase